MTYRIDMTDIPAVTADEMWQLVELLIDSGLIETLPERLTELQMAQLARHFWQRYEGTGDRGLAIINRFMALIDFLATKRLAPLIRECKWQVVVASVGIAATMRLNPKWGFNRMKLASALDEQLLSGDYAVAGKSNGRIQALLAPLAINRWTARDGAEQQWSQAS